MIFSFIKKHKISLFFAILTLFIMGLIFFYSSQGAASSSEASDGISYFLSKLFIKGFLDLSPEEQEIRIRALVPFVRKGAHICIFASLGFLSLLTLANFLKEKLKGLNLKYILSNALFCLVYAISDETHQLFVEGRSGNIKDVFIDFGGSIAGILVAIFLFYLATKKEKEKGSKK